DRVGVDVAFLWLGGDPLIGREHPTAVLTGGRCQRDHHRAGEQVVARAAARHREHLAAVKLVLVELLALPRQVFRGARGLDPGSVGHPFEASPALGVDPPKRSALPCQANKKVKKKAALSDRLLSPFGAKG